MRTRVIAALAIVVLVLPGLSRASAPAGGTEIPPHDPGESADALAGDEGTRVALTLAIVTIAAILLFLIGRAFLENRSQKLAERNATQGVDEGGPRPSNNPG